MGTSLLSLALSLALLALCSAHLKPLLCSAASASASAAAAWAKLFSSCPSLNLHQNRPPPPPPLSPSLSYHALSFQPRRVFACLGWLSSSRQALQEKLCLRPGPLFALHFAVLQLPHPRTKQSKRSFNVIPLWI
ncbi:hypothetical protein V8C26DRAFT_135568 [Trichoderma gracile]